VGEVHDVREHHRGHRHFAGHSGCFRECQRPLAFGTGLDPVVLAMGAMLVLGTTQIIAPAFDADGPAAATVLPVAPSLAEGLAQPLAPDSPGEAWQAVKRRLAAWFRPARVHGARPREFPMGP
jgi:hypothetical protein